MNTWFSSLITDTPQAGYELAITLSRAAIRFTQTDPDVRDAVRTKYADDARALIAGSQVVATHFATIAAANRYWVDVPGARP